MERKKWNGMEWRKERENGNNRENWKENEWKIRESKTHRKT